MTENMENLVLEQLRAIRATLTDHTQRFERIEQRLSVIEHQMAGFMAAYAGTQDELAQLRRRVERIEARLELSD